MKKTNALGGWCLNLIIWLAALLWLLPILVALWVAIHPASDQADL